MYAIIDVETTGLRAVSEKIIDIAVIIHDGEKIVDEFQSLVNPERIIPSNITRLTGISNEMVQDAPKFWEIAREIVQITQDKTFVAHNVNFDYSFVRKEFAELGYTYKRTRQCTVRLSRKLMPGRSSYSLGNICRDLGFENESRHRAYGDAKATALLFTHLMQLQKENSPENSAGGHNGLDILSDLPAKTGVYYFLNNQGDTIYIGKSKNIRSRILSHFQDARSRKSRNMLEQIHDISFELTGSELVALLKESHEIKIHKPVFNKKQRRGSTEFGVFFYKDASGYIRFRVDRNRGGQGLLVAFPSHRQAREYLFNLCEKNNLCQKLCGLYDSAGACFYYHVHQCRGACIGRESPADYNQRASRAIEHLNLKYNNFFIIEPGRHPEEKAVVQIENNCYQGYGYLEDQQQANLEMLRDAIRYYPDNQDVQRILKNYLRNDSQLEILPY